MSWNALNWASEQQCATSAAKFVLIILADKADEQLTCYPGVAFIAKVTQHGESTVRRALTQLVTGGQIRVLQRWGARGSRRSNRYQLLVNGPETPLPEVGDWKAEYTPKKKAKKAAEKPGAGSETIPLAASGMPDQDDQTARSERFDIKPLGASGTNRSEREVTYKEEEPSVRTTRKTPPTPPAVGQDAGPHVVMAESGGDTSRKIQTIDDAVAWFCSTPRAIELVGRWGDKWRAPVVKQALERAMARDLGDLKAVTTALWEMAKTDETRSARRLVEAGPWWEPRGASFVPAQRDTRPRCEQPGHNDPEDACRQCASEAHEAPKAADGGAVDPRAASAARTAEEALRRNIQNGRGRAAGLYDAVRASRERSTLAGTSS